MKAKYLPVHQFLELNLPEYDQAHLDIIIKFFHNTKCVRKDQREDVHRWIRDFKNFILVEWQGNVKEILPPPVDYGTCHCGMKFALRTNSKSGNKFLGCTGYPQCTNTQPFFH